jgi:hypothetical protein
MGQTAAYQFREMVGATGIKPVTPRGDQGVDCAQQVKAK